MQRNAPLRVQTIIWKGISKVFGSHCQQKVRAKTIFVWYIFKIQEPEKTIQYRVSK